MIRSEDHFKIIFQHAADAVFVTDPQGNVVEVNETACQALGYTRAEILNLKVSDFITDFNGRDIQVLDLDLDDGVVAAVDVHHKTKDGGRYPAELKISVINLDGADHNLILSRENTERIETEKELIRSEAKYRLLAENMTDVVFVMNLDLKVSYVTPSVEKFLGYSPDEITKMNLEEFMLPESVELARNTMDEQLAAEAEQSGVLDIPGTLELQFRTKNASILWSEATSTFVRDSLGRIVGIQGVSRNITDRKRAEAIVKESEARHRDMFQQNPLPMIVYDSEALSILDVNRAAIQHYGYSLDEFLDLTFKDIQPTPVSTSPGTPGIKTMRRRDIRHLKKDGTSIVVETLSQPAHYLDKPAELVLIHDLTESRIMEETMKKNAQLVAAGQIASGIAHEINNPLATISASVEALLARIPELRKSCNKEDTAKQIIDVYQDYLGIMFEEVQRSGKIIEDLLDLARIKNYDLQRVDLIELTQSTIKLFSVQSRLENYKFVFKQHYEKILLQADRDKIRQVLIILLNNAVEAMPDGGRININCDMNTENSTVGITVSDHGTGLDNADMGRIFEPFYTTKGKGGGSGLGLSIADNIITKHGGRISAEKNRMSGMTFHVVLPVGKIHTGDIPGGGES